MSEVLLMKKYIKPEMNAELLELVDVIETSTEPDSSARLLKTTVNGNKGTSYGSQEMSVFD